MRENMNEHLNRVECPGCGELVNDMAVACPNCGEKINVEVPADITPTRHPPVELPPPDASVLSPDRRPED